MQPMPSNEQAMSPGDGVPGAATETGTESAVLIVSVALCSSAAATEPELADA